MPDDPKSVFLSYARDEAPYVHAVAVELEKRGMSAQYADEVTGGDSWAVSLSEGLDAADVIVVFVSSATFESPRSNFEFGAALGHQKRFVPVYLTESALRSPPTYLSGVTGIDAHDLKPDQLAERIAGVVEDE